MNFPPSCSIMGKRAQLSVFLLIVLSSIATINTVGALPPLQIEDPRFLGDRDTFPVPVPVQDSNLLADPNYRLPTTITPLNYELKIKPILIEMPGTSYTQFTAPGEVTITIRAEEGTDSLTLHAKGLDMNEGIIEIKKEDNSTIRVVAASQDTETDFYTMQLSEELVSGATYKVFIAFTAKVNQDLLSLDGIYLSYYDDPETKQRRNLSTTQFQPGSARKAFPCFDEPQFKATFDITVGYAPGFETLSNTNKIGSPVPDVDPDFAGWKWDKYNQTVKMSTYLVAFIVSDFTFTEGPGNFGKPIRTYGPKHLIDQNGGKWAADAAENMIAYFQNFTKIDYALPKLDSVAIPQFSAGAMENWGLNTYRTAYIIHIPGLNTEAERKKITQVLGHEISHQWFGNLVTCQWWSDTWLNEGFARFLQYRGMNIADPSLNTSIAIISDATQLGMVYDHGIYTHPVLNNAQSLTQVDEIFDRISYDKGASLLRMLEGVLTTSVFDDSLRHYINKTQYQNAVQSDLFDSFQELGVGKLPTDVTIHKIMRSWTTQSGYPIVRVNVAGTGNNKIYLAQEKFLLNTPGSPSSSQSDAGKSTGLLWYIPIKIVGASNPDFEDKSPNVWIPDNAATISYSQQIDTTKWLIVNPDLSGYYRVLYDQHLLQLIKNQLDSDHTKISAGTRSQILEDYFNFANSGHVQIETTLDLTTYLHKETELVVWAPVLTNLRALLSKFATDEAKVNILKSYIWGKFEGALNIWNWTQALNEEGAQVILRAQLLDFACVLDPQVCLQKMGLTFPSSAEIPADIRPVVYCAGVAVGNNSVWHSVLDLYAKETNEVIKGQLLSALSCTSDLRAFNEYMQFAIDGTYGFDLVPTLKAISKNSVGREAAFKFITENFNGFIDGPKFADVVATLSAYFGQESQHTNLRAFIETHQAALEPVVASLNASIARIEANIYWWTGDGKYISDWINPNAN